VCLSSCSSSSGQNALSRTQDVFRVSSITPATKATPLPIHPCSYFSLKAAEKVTRSMMTETINRIEQAVGYSVFEYDGSRCNVNVDISSIRADSSPTLVTEMLVRTFEGFPRAPTAVPGLGQEAYMDADVDPHNGYINLVYEFAQHGLLVETIAVVGSMGASGSTDSLRAAEFAMSARL
jgi:hypothetical protein